MGWREAQAYKKTLLTHLRKMCAHISLFQVFASKGNSALSHILKKLRWVMWTMSMDAERSGHLKLCAQCGSQASTDCHPLSLTQKSKEDFSGLNPYRYGNRPFTSLATLSQPVPSDSFLPAQKKLSCLGSFVRRAKVWSRSWIQLLKLSKWKHLLYFWREAESPSTCWLLPICSAVCWVPSHCLV